MRLFISSILLLFISAHIVFATHNRAGEITYEQVDAFTYKITIVTFTYTLSQADRPELEVQWGDNTSSIVPRQNNIMYLPNDYKRNIYIGTHTYPGPGVYEIVMMDQNRNYGVNNIPGSVNVPFTIKTTLMINPNIGYNNTPVLLNYPIDIAAINEIFIHNPAAYDPDGDSLSYKMYTCLGEDGDFIPNYTLPPTSDSIVVNPYTGDFIWSKPTALGTYNVAMLIEEWREGIKIGQIVRDIQIEVVKTNNNPPRIEPLEDLCVVAGTSVYIDVSASDPNLDGITLTAYGGPLQFMQDSTAFFNTNTSGNNTGRFTWNTNCSHIRQQPYQIVFKAEDNDSEQPLIDFKTVFITVVCPAPENLITKPSNNSIELSWSQDICTNADGYKIYRRIEQYPFTPDTCETGVPTYTGYSLIGTTNDHLDTVFNDNNNGDGLNQGFIYCYRVIAWFSDGAESYTSEEACDALIRGIPVITKVSVENTDTLNGVIHLEWAKPIEYDTVLYPGPYKYLIYHSLGYWGNYLMLIDSISDINDTVYYDSLLNTSEYSYSYKVEFYSIDSMGNRVLVGSPQISSSVFIETIPDDNQVIIEISKNTPWFNSEYVVYRMTDTVTMTYDSIGVTDTLVYYDYDLANGYEFCYYVKSIGSYGIDNIVDPIINLSQKACETPLDTTAACSPELHVTSDCDSLRRNILTWSKPDFCAEDDIVGYNIYHAYYLTDELTLLGTIDSNEINSFGETLEFIHPLEEGLSIAGCYMVTSLDSLYNNESDGVKICVDYCPFYELPNVFTPNGDNINDLFKPGPYYYVDRIDLKVFNRWGQLVFETEDPDINWDGKHMDNGKFVSDGVYFYVCDVYEYRLVGIVPRNITGFVHIFGDSQKSQY